MGHAVGETVAADAVAGEVRALWRQAALGGSQ